MARPHTLNISLAAKCRLLFGLAVLLIIAVALLVPWYYMERLVDELNVRRTREMARFARTLLQPSQADWNAQHERLVQWWTANADDLDLPNDVPLFVPRGQPTAPSKAEADPFIRHAMQTLEENQHLTELRTTEDLGDGHRLYRLALAVRSGASPQESPQLLGLVVASFASHESDAQLWPNRIVIVTAGALAGFLAILVFYLITDKLILAPIQDLKEVVEKVSTGDLDVRADVETGDEFEQLADAVNEMLISLKRGQEELKTINRSLDVRLGELAETNVNLYEANRLKSEFLANVSHELRTPLTSIIGFAELLRDAGQTGDEQARKRMTRYAHNILTSGRMLLELINDLLDLAKIEAGRMELHRTNFSLRDVCDALIDFTRPLVEQNELTLNAVIDDDLPIMHSDAGKIHQILYNLLSNAIKFTPAGGKVRLEVARQGNDHVRLVVADTGPGIPKNDHEAVFEKFRQADSSVTREYSGTGLGLPISRELVGMLGGTIALDSDEGRGTTFTVVLPIESPERATMPLVPLT